MFDSYCFFPGAMPAINEGFEKLDAKTAIPLQTEEHKNSCARRDAGARVVLANVNLRAWNRARIPLPNLLISKFRSETEWLEP